MHSSSLRWCALGLLSIASAAVHAAVSGGPQQLGARPGHQESEPAVDGTGAVWTDFDGTQFDIYYVDVAKGGTPQNLTNTPGDNEFLEDIDQGLVCYTHSGGPTNASGDILLYNAATGTTSNVASSDALVHFQHPSLGGNYVVFERVSSAYDIELYDRTVGTAVLVTNDAAEQLYPRVDGDYVVYEDYGRNGINGPADVYGYRVSTSGPAFLIARDASRPDIDGTNVVYVGNDAAGMTQVFLYDLASGAARQLTHVTSGKATARISGARVVWTDNRRGHDDVFTLDLSTGVEDVIDPSANAHAARDISFGRVVYNSIDASGISSAWLFNVTAPPPPPPPPPPSPLPFGCDPVHTDLVAGPTTLQQNGRHAAHAHGHFDSRARKTYYLCVDNGLPDGSERSAHVFTWVDGDRVMTPRDFQPAADPPRHVAKKLDLDDEEGDDEDEAHRHHWDALIFRHPSSRIAVSIRVAN